jgi:hypothetical protein
MSDTGPRPAVGANDLELLRHFEPILRFTLGESFFPMSVSNYLGAAAHVRRRGEIDSVLAVAGELSELSLASDLMAADGAREFVTVAGAGDPERVTDLFMRSGGQAVGFRRGAGRLARVGYASRIVDALFSLVLLARGRVPGTLARRAVQRYGLVGGGGHPYYGRVVRTETWTVLQYWFFYAFNDWRSGFNGANDHEADWEQVLVYCYADADGRVNPRWVAYAQHDYEGRDLRRRWDDAEELELVGDHPVVNAGAGSHASYFRAGEYLAEQELGLPGPIKSIVNGFSRLLRGSRGRHEQRMLPIAFVDFARGDGLQIGPGCDRTWSPVLLDETQTWVSSYRGLWGLSVEDPFEGEDAPAGPMFNRDGTVRRSWADPVAFAELDTVPPPSQELELLSKREAVILTRGAELEGAIPDLERRLAAAGAEKSHLVNAPSPTSTDELTQLRSELTALYDERAQGVLRLGALRQRGEVLRGGHDDPPQAHLRRVATPAPAGASVVGRLLEAWAAISIGLLLLALVTVLLLAPDFGLLAACAVIAAFVFVESVLQRGVTDLIVTSTRIMAFAAGVVLAVAYWQPAVIATAIAAGLFVIRENVAELVRAAR